MWRALKIAWRIAWGTVELAIVIYVLSAIQDRQTGLIVGVLGLIYATIRVMFLNQPTYSCCWKRGLSSASTN
jgi:hypothetical protein